jgi:hypothetical protein
MNWTDITSYSQGDRDRTPRSWEARCGNLRLIVTRHHGLEGWFTTVNGFYSMASLGSTEIAEAKAEAIQRLKHELLSSLQALEAQ